MTLVPSNGNKFDIPSLMWITVQTLRYVISISVFVRIQNYVVHSDYEL